MLSAKTMIAVGALVIPSLIHGQRVSADGAHQTLEYLSNQYFEQVYFRYSPTAGTSAGVHTIAGKLGVYSAASWRREIGARL